MLEGCLRAVPEFVRRRRQDDPAEEEITVASGAGALKMTIVWVQEEQGDEEDYANYDEPEYEDTTGYQEGELDPFADDEPFEDEEY